MTGRASESAQSRELWPRDFGRDGVSGLVSPGRAMRARDVSRPRAADERAAEQVLASLLARIDGRRRSAGPSIPSPLARGAAQESRDFS